jgi:hypothetical protein
MVTFFVSFVRLGVAAAALGVPIGLAVGSQPIENVSPYHHTQGVMDGEVTLAAAAAAAAAVNAAEMGDVLTPKSRRQSMKSYDLSGTFISLMSVL